MIPKAAIIRAFGIDPPERYVTNVIAMTINIKFSGGPIFRAASAKIGARKSKANTDMVPAMNEPIAEIPRAEPARPLRAILYPSIHVTAELTSPGILSKMDVVDPPY